MSFVFVESCLAQPGCQGSRLYSVEKSPKQDFPLHVESRLDPVTIDGVSSFILIMALSVGCRCLPEDALRN